MQTISAQEAQQCKMKDPVTQYHILSFEGPDGYARAGGVACTGGTGEDYVVPGQNALVLETADPWEFVTLFRELRANPARDRAPRRAGRTTAEHLSWRQIVRRVLLPRLHVVADHLRFGKLRLA